MLLQEFDINVVKQSSIKGQEIINLIKELPYNDIPMVHEEFLSNYN